MRTCGLNKFKAPPIRRMILACLLALMIPAAPAMAQTASTSTVSIQNDNAYERLFVMANVEFTLLHELAHVLIWEVKPPVLGREEDAADSIAVMAQMLQQHRPGEADNIEKLQAVADGWKLEWQLVQEDALETAYWDLHALEIQRYYNIACLVYGADPENRGVILKAAQLPTDRAEWCREEYDLAKRSVDWLLTQLPAAAGSAANDRRGEMTVSYAPNTTLEGEKLDKWLHDSGIAERLAEVMNQRFDLPRDVNISFENCQYPNAAWDAEQAKIQFCHMLLNRFLYLARELAKERRHAADNRVWRTSANHKAAPAPVANGGGAIRGHN